MLRAVRFDEDGAQEALEGLFPVEGHGSIDDEVKPQSQARQLQAANNYAAFHGRKLESVDIQEVVDSSGGIDVWADADP